MAEPREGGCQCGAVRYVIEGDPVSLAVCHCTECQRQSGSAFGMSLTVRRADFRLVRGEVKTFTRSSDSGRAVRCAFCPDCGTRVYHEPEAIRDMVNVKPGTLDDTSWLAPTVEVWTTRRQRWVAVPAGMASFPENPTRRR